MKIVNSVCEYKEKMFEKQACCTPLQTQASFYSTTATTDGTIVKLFGNKTSLFALLANLYKNLNSSQFWALLVPEVFIFTFIGVLKAK